MPGHHEILYQSNHHVFCTYTSYNIILTSSLSSRGAKGRIEFPNSNNSKFQIPVVKKNTYAIVYKINDS